MDENRSKLTDLFKDQFNETIYKQEQHQTILMGLLANEWIERAKLLPDPDPLFGNIWHHGEVAICNLPFLSNTQK